MKIGLLSLCKGHLEEKYKCKCWHICKISANTQILTAGESTASPPHAVPVPAVLINEQKKREWSRRTFVSNWMRDLPHICPTLYLIIFCELFLKNSGCWIQACCDWEELVILASCSLFQSIYLPSLSLLTPLFIHPPVSLCAGSLFFPLFFRLFLSPFLVFSCHSIPEPIRSTGTFY